MSTGLMRSTAGLAVGPLFALIGLLVIPDVSDQLLLAGYAIALMLIAAAVTLSTRAGLLLAVLTIITETLTELAYFVSVYGIDISLLPYAVGFVLFVGRIALFPLAGAFGGYLGREFFAEESKGKMGEKARTSRRRGRRPSP